MRRPPIPETKDQWSTLCTLHTCLTLVSHTAIGFQKGERQKRSMFTGPSKDGIGNLGEYVEGVGYLVRRNAYQRWFGERMENEPENLKRSDLK